AAGAPRGPIGGAGSWSAFSLLRWRRPDRLAKRAVARYICAMDPLTLLAPAALAPFPLLVAGPARAAPFLARRPRRHAPLGAPAPSGGAPRVGARPAGAAGRCPD